MAVNVGKLIKDIRNYNYGDLLSPSKEPSKKSISNYIAPVQLTRLRHDIRMYRECVGEAELAYYPHRVRMQRMFLDTQLNGHVYAVWERRKDLTLLRDYKICDNKGKESTDLTQQFKEAIWFQDFMDYSMEAKAKGYSLIELGDLVNDEFPNINSVRRWNVSPDRHNMTKLIYENQGIDFLSDEYKDWYIYVPTTSDTGVSPCGYGLFYNVAPYEILLRNLIGYNADFVELYAQPYRIGTTNKSDETERAKLEEAIRNMGSNGYAILDDIGDDIKFLETKLSGTGWESYDNLEQRCEKKISKIIGGHADAIDSVPGKLGGGQGGGKDSGNANPVQQAWNDKQTKDGKFITAIINNQLFPKIRNIGYKIPEGYHFEFKNDQELLEVRRHEDETNRATAEIAVAMSQAGLQMEPEYFQTRTGIPTTAKPIPTLPKTPPFLNTKTLNRLNNIYNKHKK